MLMQLQFELLTAVIARIVIERRLILLSKLTCDDLVETLRCIASLVEDLLSEDYKCILTARFLTDLLELRCSKKH